MIALETKDKRWKDMREDLGERLATRGFIKKHDCSYMTREPNFGRLYGIQVVNGTPSQIRLEGMALQFTYDFKNQELFVWGTAQRHAGASYGVEELVELRALLTAWKNDWEQKFNGQSKEEK